METVNSLDFDRRTLAILAAVLAAAVGLTLFFTRSPSAQPAPVVVSGPTTPSTPAPSTSARPSPSGEVVVEVVGKVLRPSVVTLPAGSRVQDAVEAAGGAKPGVDTSDENLARVLADGEQIRIGLAPPTGPRASPGSSAAPAGGPVDINSASLEDLQEIPGVGPVIAARIVTYREQNGGFRAVEELLEVSGIGEVTFAQMQPLVTVGAGG